jgi:hypothetical protein
MVSRLSSAIGVVLGHGIPHSLLATHRPTEISPLEHANELIHIYTNEQTDSLIGENLFPGEPFLSSFVIDAETFQIP